MLHHTAQSIFISPVKVQKRLDYDTPIAPLTISPRLDPLIYSNEPKGSDKKKKSYLSGRKKYHTAILPSLIESLAHSPTFITL